MDNKLITRCDSINWKRDNHKRYSALIIYLFCLIVVWCLANRRLNSQMSWPLVHFSFLCQAGLTSLTFAWWPDYSLPATISKLFYSAFLLIINQERQKRKRMPSLKRCIFSRLSKTLKVSSQCLARANVFNESDSFLFHSALLVLQATMPTSLPLLLGKCLFRLPDSTAVRRTSIPLTAALLGLAVNVGTAHFAFSRPEMRPSHASASKLTRR